MANPNVIDVGMSVVQHELARIDLNYDPDNAAGVYTVDIHLQSDSVILDIGVVAESLWNPGGNATMDVGDAADPNGFFTSINLKATDLLAGESINFAATGGKQGAYFAGTTLINAHWEQRYSASDRTISFVLTTTGAAPTTGSTLCYVSWMKAVPSQGNIRTGTYVAS